MKISSRLRPVFTAKPEITITSSSGYKVCRKLDYDLFTRSPIPLEAKSVLSTTKESMKRYINSKLGVLYIAMELGSEAPGVRCQSTYGSMPSIQVSIPWFLP